MKLEMSLPERVGFLHAVPLLDVLVLLLVAIFFGSPFLNKSGIQVELPVSKFQLARDIEGTVVTVAVGEPPVIWLGRKKVEESDLRSHLQELRDKSAAIPSVYLRVDRRVSTVAERKYTELLLQEGFRVYLLADPESDQ